jgi:hypothetical protein
MNFARIFVSGRYRTKYIRYVGTDVNIISSSNLKLAYLMNTSCGKAAWFVLIERYDKD